MSFSLSDLAKHQLFRSRYTKLSEIYWFMALRSFALALVMVFIPIYLYRSDFGVSNIFLYYIVMYLTEFLCELPAAKLIRRKGPKLSMVLSLPFMIAHFGMLLTLDHYNWSPFLLASTLGISLAFFWEGYHYDFSRSKHIKRTTQDVGRVHMILIFSGALAPLVGGLIATYFGMNWVLLLLIVLLSIGSLILLKRRDNNFRKGKVELRKVDLASIEKHIIAYVGLGWETAASSQVWPLFLFLIVGSYSGIGFITSATLVVSVIVVYWVCNKADKNGGTGYIRTGSLISAAIGLTQIFVQTGAHALMVNSGRSLANSFVKPPFDAEYYLHADKESRSEYICIMESAVDLSRLVFHLVLYILSLSFSLKTVLIVGLLMGAAGSSLISLMPAAKCPVCGKIESKEIKIARRLNA